MSVLITYEVPVGQFAAEIQAIERRLEGQLNEARDDILKFVENAQIKAYTATGNPSRPAGSDYVRTFTLQNASEKEITGRKLPDISGVWRVNEAAAPYAEYVLGTRQEQAKIHRGRWKPKTQVAREAQEAAPGLIERRLKG